MAGAIDVPPEGFDDTSGAGRLDAFNVLTALDACDDANACTRDTCTPETGCQHAALADGAACPDGDLCNGNETCTTGQCTPGTPLVCNDGSACTTDACSPAVGCVFTDTCDDGDPCSTDTCDTLAGCSHAPAPDDTPCPDADLCNGAEVCLAGTCTPGEPLACDDGGPCTNPSCDALRGCQYPQIEGFAGITCLCDDGLDATGCNAPAGVAARFRRACRLVANATSAKPGKARRLLASVGQNLVKAARQTRRATNGEKLSADCGNALGVFLDDTLARTRVLRSGL
jgi:hypothetical protein